MAASMRCVRREVTGMLQAVKHFINNPLTDSGPYQVSLCSNFNTCTSDYSDSPRWLKIGPLPTSYPDEKVLKYLEEYGKVASWNRPLLPFNSKYALVKFRNKDNALKVVEDLSYLDGVKLLQKKEKVVYIRSLRQKANSEDVKEHFSKYGEITSVWVKKRPSNYAFVQFEKEKDAKVLKKEKRLRIDNMKLDVKSVIRNVKRSEETETSV